eukprot:scaffold323_cov414-Prasinococcus_capsulatus_cf.AAC.7
MRGNDRVQAGLASVRPTSSASSAYTHAGGRVVTRVSLPGLTQGRAARIYCDACGGKALPLQTHRLHSGVQGGGNDDRRGGRGGGA